MGRCKTLDSVGWSLHNWVSSGIEGRIEQNRDTSQRSKSSITRLETGVFFAGHGLERGQDPSTWTNRGNAFRERFPRTGTNAQHIRARSL